MSFTPGPWRVIRETPDAGFVGYTYFVVQDNEDINPISPATLRTEDDVIAQTTEADANLIAAAPDLYEALREEVEAGMANETVGVGHVTFAVGLAALRKANPDYLDIHERPESAKQEERP